MGFHVVLVSRLSSSSNYASGGDFSIKLYHKRWIEPFNNELASVIVCDVVSKKKRTFFGPVCWSVDEFNI